MAYIFPPEFCEQRSFINSDVLTGRSFDANGQIFETANDAAQIAVQRELSSLRELARMFATTLTTTDALNVLSDFMQRLLPLTARRDTLRHDALAAFAEISALMLERAATRERTRELASTDALTGLQNLRAFRSRLIQQLAAHHHNSVPFSVLYLNIDDFAALNRRESHAHGDFVLREVARLLKENLPPACAVARAHDDVFLVLLQDSLRDESLTIAGDLQAALETHIFNFDERRQTNITVSIGVASCPHDGETLDQLLARAAHHSHKRRDRHTSHRALQPMPCPPFIEPPPNVIRFAPRLNNFN